MKYLIVTGGVVSGIGKGITISSIGRLLKSCGTSVTSIKIDPYLNVDAGTMSPYEHGETFVLDDGSETDLDLGNYERFLDISLTGKHNITTGKVYHEVILGERRGDYLGKTVQIVPHVTDMIQKWIQNVAIIPVDKTGKVPDVCLIEVGGTVGDIESMVFLEALRQLQFSLGRENVMFVHVSLVPSLNSVGEQKTKPTQHSMKELRAVGIIPDIVVCRSELILSESTLEKMSLFCQLPKTNIITVYDVSNIYHVPLILMKQNIHTIIQNRLNLPIVSPNMLVWENMAKIVDNAETNITIAIVGKYTSLLDAYASLIKSIKHAGIFLNTNIIIEWIDSTDLEINTLETSPENYSKAWKLLHSVKGIIVAGGFGIRGVEGKILASKYARENKVPFLGICLGMQVMVIEYSRSVLGLKDANSTEFDDKTINPVVIFMPEINPLIMGGNMRLGNRSTIIKPDTLAMKIYGYKSEDMKCIADERHRHRYEVNPEMINKLEMNGLIFSGYDQDKQRMEIVELNCNDHPFYIGTQFHPEFKSRPNRPSPPFYAFASVCCGKSNELHKAGLWRREYEERGSSIAL